MIDSAFSVIYDGVEHSHLRLRSHAAGPRTAVGPMSVEVVEPMRTIRLMADRNANGLGADLTFRARTVAIEEPRQRIVAPDGVPVMDHTRLTQWGSWEGKIWIDGTTIDVDPAETIATRDRSWGVRAVGKQLETQREQRRSRRSSGTGCRCTSTTSAPTWRCMSATAATAGSRPP